LVLDPTQSGLVLAVNARIYCKITQSLSVDFAIFDNIERFAVKYHVAFRNPQFPNIATRKLLLVLKPKFSTSRSILDHFDLYERYVSH